MKTGLVGYGLAGRVFHTPLFEAAGLELTAVASSRPDEVHRDHPRAEVVATPAALFARDDIQLVVVATPNDTHAPLALQALEAGKHVVVDKPFANTVDDARAVFAAADRAGKVACPFQNRRWDSDFLTLRALVENGDLGDIVSYRAHYDRYVPQTMDRWRERPGPGAGNLYDLGVHLVDQAVCLFGMPDWVDAEVMRQREGAEVDDAFHLRIAFGATRAVIECSMLAADNAARKTVHGTRGSYVKHHEDVQEAQLFAGMRAGQPGFGVEQPENWARVTRIIDGEPVAAPHESAVGTHYQLYAQVREAIESGADLPVRRAQVLATLASIEAAFESSASGRRVALPGNY